MRNEKNLLTSKDFLSIVFLSGSVESPYRGAISTNESVAQFAYAFPSSKNDPSSKSAVTDAIAINPRRRSESHTIPDMRKVHATREK